MDNHILSGPTSRRGRYRLEILGDVNPKVIGNIVKQLSLTSEFLEDERSGWPLVASAYGVPCEFRLVGERTLQHLGKHPPKTPAEAFAWREAVDAALIIMFRGSLPSPPGAEVNFSNEAERDGVSLKPNTSSQPASEAGKLSSAANDVLAERERQKNVEGWTPEHDDTHASFEMARAAAFYALHTAADILPEPSSDAPSDRYGLFLTADMAWPPQWDHSTWKKPKDARRNLVRSAALLIAEIERLDRAEAKLSTDEVQE